MCNNKTKLNGKVLLGDLLCFQIVFLRPASELRSLAQQHRFSENDVIALRDRYVTKYYNRLAMFPGYRTVYSTYSQHTNIIHNYVQEIKKNTLKLQDTLFLHLVHTIVIV